MPERELVESALPRRVVQGAAPHFRAQRAGIFLLADVENDLCDLRGDDGIGHVQLPAQPFDAAHVKRAQAHIERDRFQRVRNLAEFAVKRQRVQQQQAVLAARYAHAHAVARLDHRKILIRPADASQNGFHALRHTPLPIGRASIRP